MEAVWGKQDPGQHVAGAGWGPAGATLACVKAVGGFMSSAWEIRFGNRDIDLRDLAPRSVLKIVEEEMGNRELRKWRRRTEANPPLPWFLSLRRVLAKKVGGNNADWTGYHAAVASLVFR